MTVITLEMQLAWAEKCLDAMKKKGSPQGDVTLQECVVGTLWARLKEKRNV